MPALLYGNKFFVLLDLFGDFNTCVFIVILHYSAKSSFGSFGHFEASDSRSLVGAVLS